MSKKQFFSALKLVAAYQANISIQCDVVTSNLELPLPRFTWSNLENETQIPDLIELRSEGNEYLEQIDANSTDSEVDSDTLSIVRNGSPEISSTASDSPTPTNSVQDRSWAVGGAWQGLVSEEQRQLLGKQQLLKIHQNSKAQTNGFICANVWIITFVSVIIYCFVIFFFFGRL